jgi:alkylhydroperoxidase/carboxymuconolactone decarboxylase family protein YurZ
MEKVSNGFQLFMTETDGVGKAFLDSIMLLSEKSSLEPKVHELAYISVLVASRMYEGLDFHIHHALELGATKEEVKSAVLLPMPIIGLQVADALPYMVKLFEDSEKGQ